MGPVSRGAVLGTTCVSEESRSGMKRGLSQSHTGLWSCQDQRRPELGKGTGPVEPTLTTHWPWATQGGGVPRGHGWCSCFWKLGNECLGLDLERGSVCKMQHFPQKASRKGVCLHFKNEQQ